MEKQLSPEWKQFIDTELTKPYMVELRAKVKERRLQTNVYPPSHLTFNAFIQCPYDQVKVVILGQDPYHTPGMAHGLAFSALQGNTPPSLKNIFSEIYTDIFNGNTGGVNVSQHNDLSQWAHQGVLLLNTVLTVEEGKAKSHAGMGWETFTKTAVSMVNNHNRKLVFMLWGKDAKEYRKFIDDKKHLVLEADHPASAVYSEGKWFGNKHFSKANAFILKHYFNHIPQINWGIFERPNQI